MPGRRAFVTREFTPMPVRSPRAARAAVMGETSASVRACPRMRSTRETEASSISPPTVSAGSAAEFDSAYTPVGGFWPMWRPRSAKARILASCRAAWSSFLRVRSRWVRVMAPRAATIRSVPVSSMARTWLPTMARAMAPGLVSALACFNPAASGSRAARTAPTPMTTKPRPPRTAKIRGPRRISWVESAASTPIIMRTKRNIMRIAPV